MKYLVKKILSFEVVMHDSFSAKQITFCDLISFTYKHGEPIVSNKQQVPSHQNILKGE